MRVLGTLVCEAPISFDNELSQPKESGLNWRILAPLLICATLVQMAVPLTRIISSYRAIELDLPESAVGILSAAFALLPILFTISIGRFNDRHGEAPLAMAGGIVIALSVTALWLASNSLGMMLALTSLLGIGQVMLMSPLQMVTTQCSSPAQHDTVLGYFLVAISAGHVFGPLLVAVTTPPGELHPSSAFQVIVVVCALLLVVACIALATGLRARKRKIALEAPPMGTILKVPGLLVIILASSVCVTANDLLLVYFPVMGASRGIDAATIGWLLSLRAAMSMASRFVFKRLVTSLGRARLMTVSLAISGVSTAMLAIEQPIWTMAACLIIAGFALGLAIACSLSLILSIAPQGGTATAMSVRLTANRLGQFFIPVASVMFAAVFGVGGIFAIVGGSIMVCSAVFKKTSRKVRL